MNVTPETLAELRRLHAASDETFAALNEHANRISGWDDKWHDLCQTHEDAMEALITAVDPILIPMLDELEAVRAERDGLRNALKRLFSGSTDIGVREEILAALRDNAP